MSACVLGGFSGKREAGRYTQLQLFSYGLLSQMEKRRGVSGFRS